MNTQDPFEHQHRLEAFQRTHRTGLVTLVFTDLVDSVALRRQLGDQAGTSLLQAHRQLVRQTLARFADAEEIETAGDSFLLLFARPSEAVKFALLVQVQTRALARERNVPLTERIGIHVGEVVIEEHERGSKPKDIYGTQIDLCARVMGLAQGGQILLTRAVFDSARQALKGEDIERVKELSWLNHGPYLLKGIEESVEVCEVGEAGIGVLKAPAGSEKAQRQVSPDTEPVLGWRPALGQVVPNTQWVLEKKLGEGGFGEVWLGRHQAMKERRVFKFCFRADRVRSLKREMTLFRLLKESVGDHPHIVALRDVNFDEPPFYVVMDHVDGQDLKAWSQQQGGVEKVPVEARLEIVAQIADALQAAHDSGVIHRDVKPGNILISDGRSAISALPETNPKSQIANRESDLSQPSTLNSQPTAKLTDFGIGQVVSEEALKGMTKAGFTQTMMSDSSSSQTGSQMYMAPELLAGKPASTRSDIYSLGVVLYQLLVGDLTRPLTTDWTDHITDPLLRDDLKHCFAGNPNERFAGAGQLSKHLRSLPERHAALAEQQAMVAAHARAAYRRGMIRTAGVAVVIIAVLTVLVAVALKQSRIAREQANMAAHQTKIAESKAEESRRRLVELNVANGIRLMNEGQLFGSLPWFTEALTLDQGDPRREEIHRVRLGAIRQQCPALVQVLFHEQAVTCAAFSLDGRHVATATGGRVAFMFRKEQQNEARVWDAETGQPVGAPLKHGGGITHLVYSPDGRRIATASMDNTARVWDALTGQPVTPPLQHSNSVVRIAFSPDGKHLATASTDHTARVWDATTGEPLTGPLEHIDMVHDVTFSPDGRRLATASTDSLVRIWEVTSAKLLLSNMKHQSGVDGGVVFSPDGRRLVSASQDRSARLWDADSGNPVGQPLKHGDYVVAASFSPEGRRVATGSRDGTARIWDSETGEPVTSPLKHDSAVYAASFSPDGVHVVTASEDQTARIWDATTGQALTPPLNHNGPVLHATFSPKGDRFITVSADRTARVWSLASPIVPVELKHELSVRTVAFSPDSQRVLTASFDRTARIWDAKTGDPIGTPLQHLRAVATAAFSQDGRRIVTASFDNTARVWDALTGKPVTPPLMHREEVRHAALSPNGLKVATASYDKTARVWDAETGEPITPPLAHSREVQYVSFSPDGLRIATACRDRSARVWDATTGQLLLGPLQHGNWVLEAKYSPDGKRLLTASTDATARIWDARSGALLATLQHKGLVITVSFSADGRRAITASGDGTAQMWDIETGQALTPPLRHADGVRATFSPDDRFVLTTSWDGSARIWNAATGDPVTPPLRANLPIRYGAFSPDGRLFATAIGADARVWTLPEEGRPVSELVALAQLLNGRQIDPQGKLAAVSLESLQRVWHDWRAKHPEQFTTAPGATRAWHQGKLKNAEHAQQWFAALFHLDRLQELPPADQALRRWREELEAKRAQQSQPAFEETVPDLENRASISPRDPQAPPLLVDLSDHYNVTLTDGWDSRSEFNNISSLARGVQVLAGITFDVRGIIHLQGAQAKSVGWIRPEQAKGIQVRQKCRRLHFLHSTTHNEADGRHIATCVIRLAGGQQQEFRIHYGPDVRNFWLKVNDVPESKGTVVAWTGTNAQTAETGISFRLYKSTWENPSPEVEVENIDYVSTMSDCAPFLIAITAEP